MKVRVQREPALVTRDARGIEIQRLQRRLAAPLWMARSVSITTPCGSSAIISKPLLGSCVPA